MDLQILESVLSLGLAMLAHLHRGVGYSGRCPWNGDIVANDASAGN